jgi:hypothetical protein
MSGVAPAYRAAPVPPVLPAPGLGQTLNRIKAEYDEMPGLCLTKRQAQRLLTLDPESCDQVLAALVSIGYLRRCDSGFVRA